MKILIYGVGGVGGYFGGRLTTTSHHITFIARGAHLEAIKQKGLQIHSITGDFTAIPDFATDNLSKIEQPDLVILGIKSWQVVEAAKALKSYLKPETVVLPLQNGAANADKLVQVLPQENVLNGLCRIISFIDGPGVIKHPAFEPSITFGEVDNTRSERVNKIKSLFDQAEITNHIAHDIEAEVWKKFLFICTISGVGGLTRVPVGKIRESNYLYKVMQDTAQEILTIAQAKNIALTQKDLDKTFASIDAQDPNTTASTQRDIMEGKPSELENFNGYIVKQGKKLGVSTPVNEMIYECLLPMEKLARAKY